MQIWTWSTYVNNEPWVLYLLKVLYGLVLISLGLWCVLKSVDIAEKCQRILLKYPIIRYLGEKRLTVHPWFIILLGIVVILIGSMALIMAILGIEKIASVS